ncbi:hypothetical protein A2311_03250 [candidate division WOR-1 bacterium RIFOXYB2_FULL_48_7]|uniref:Methyltransferase type 12 domain-containing protein n=1 Tax=candidate division WOR-1 bacterium RIFOXYB2_FULL_48_7 TaxID=1802583 RepID=A0A1F4T8K7_UNCSA|nr:MAG: hypothetical protein A2311_03250 [candidate division WOR-1 bacterium RIFOXYB2_FULL_48_7]
MNKGDQIAYFEGLLAEHGESYKALDWNSVESQRLRFQILKELFIYGRKSSGLTLLDVGCGFGDWYGFLKAEGLLRRHRITYTGYDISPKIVAVAKKKYPDADLSVKDILEDRYIKKYDYVICSGVFNIRTTDTEAHLDFVKEMMARLYDLAAFGVGMNFLSEGAFLSAGSTDLNNGRYFYFKPEEIISYCRFLGARFIMRHDYHPGDFTVYLLK